MKKNFLIVCLLLLSSIFGNAQVTIGSAESAIPGSILQLKENSTNAVNASRGLGMPRVALTDIKQLYPMFSGDTDYAGNIGNKKTTEDTKHVGLTVYNTTDVYPLCPGIHYWQGEKWIPLKPCMKPKVVLGFGVQDYNIAHTNNQGVTKFANNVANFSKTSTATFYTPPMVLVNGLNNIDNMATLIKNNKVDIVYIGYGMALNSTHAKALKNFLDNNGVVIYFEELHIPLQNVLNTIFGLSVTTNVIHGGGAIYHIENIDDPITNGVFGKAQNFQWGQDVSGTAAVVSGIPANDIVVYSYGKNESTGDVTQSASITSFRHKTKKFFFAGDAGFCAGNATDNIATKSPFKITSDGNATPITKPNYGNGPTKMAAYNSIMFANALVWALKEVEKDPVLHP